MRDYTYDVYLAGPFFNDQQKAVMDNAKAILVSCGLRVCDPRDLSPVIVDLPVDQREAHLQKIFDANIVGMLTSWAIVACIDERDTGTSFELGYFFAIAHHDRDGEPEPLRVTFSANDHGCNVMLSKSVHAHFRNLGELKDMSSLLGNYIINRTDGGVIRDHGWLSVVHAPVTE